MTAPRLVHVTTTDISLWLLLGPQLTAFQRAGYEVVGVSAPGPYVEKLEALGIRHVALHNATRSMNPARDLAAVRELYRILLELRPDIVHTHNPKPGLYGRVAARTARVPVVVNTIHGLYAQPSDPFARRAVVYGLERLASTCSDAELVQNVEDIDVLRRLRFNMRQVHLLGNGIDLERFSPAAGTPSRREALRREWNLDPEHVVCGAVGRLVREKGYAELFEAARHLRHEQPKLRFVVVGPSDPAKADALTPAMIDAAVALGNVQFVGEREDVDACYSAFDLYALASHREGFPRSAMEAAATGLPIVATDIRGCRQVVRDGENGRLVPPRDAAALAEAIAAVAGDASVRRAMGRAGREKALKEFDQERCIEVTLAVYDELLGSGARRKVRAA